MVADNEELEEMDAPELHARRLNAKEVLTPQRSGNFMFLVADGTVIIFVGEQRLRTSTLTRERLERGEEQEILQAKSDELDSQTQLQDDSTRMMRKLKVTSGRSQDNSVIVITLNPESNCPCREKKHFLFRQNTSTLPEQHRWRKRIVRCMDRIHEICST